VIFAKLAFPNAQIRREGSRGFPTRRTEMLISLSQILTLIISRDAANYWQLGS
jgi:hypothetical protein